MSASPTDKEPTTTGRIKVISGRLAGHAVALDHPLTVGRDDDNGIQLIDDTCSRHHARFCPQGDRVLLTDLDSNNGTFVNGERIGERLLVDGDRITLGHTVLVFEEVRAAGATTRLATRPDTPEPAETREDDTYEVESRLHPTEVPFLAPEAPREDSEAHRRLRTIYDLSNHLASTLDPEEVLDRLLDGVLSVLPAQRAVVLLTDPGAAIPRPAAARGQHGPLSLVSSSAPRSILDRAVRERQGLRIRDVRAEDGVAGKASVVAARIASVICAPLLDGSLLCGLLYADTADATRPFREDDLAFAVAAANQAALALTNAQRFSHTDRTARELRRQTAANYESLGRSSAFRKVRDQADRAAASDSTVLLLGESGTGKEVLARRIHNISSRRDDPFVPVNCGALAETLLESELFGHEKGAFTGADRLHRGHLETADRGTLFLDEIAELSPALQVKLLRFLQEREFTRVGGTRSTRVDVRVLAATHRDLAARIAEGTFREDLFYRLNVVVLTLPPLRERAEDIHVLAEHFLDGFAHQTALGRRTLAPETLAALQSYGWPGNIRELRNVLERSVVLTDAKTILPEHLPMDLAHAPPPPEDALAEVLTLREAERRAIAAALEHTGWKKGETARLLGISWPTLNKKIRDYGIQP